MAGGCVRPVGRPLVEDVVGGPAVTHDPTAARAGAVLTLLVAHQVLTAVKAPVCGELGVGHLGLLLS